MLTSNLLAVKNMVHFYRTSSMSAILLCGNHRTSLVEVGIFDISDVFAPLYSFAALCRMGGHFVRLIQAPGQ